MIRSRLKYGLLAIVTFVIGAAATRDMPRITKEEAKALLGAPKVVFVDARLTSVWDRSDRKIKGAVRADRWDLESWAAGYDRDTTFIAY
jgi:hypothetical protein